MRFEGEIKNSTALEASGVRRKGWRQAHGERSRHTRRPPVWFSAQDRVQHRDNRGESLTEGPSIGQGA